MSASEPDGGRRPAIDLVAGEIERLRANAARFDELLAVAVARADRPVEEVAALAERAARFGGSHHPGAFSSTRLEHVVEGAGRRIGSGSGAAGPAATTGGGVRRVLHVLTSAHATGGHTRLAEHWMRHDDRRRHDLVLLDQVGTVPQASVAAVTRTGGRVHDLTEARAGHVAQVHALRALAADADVVALHHHPHDIVPGLAFAAETARPPVLLVNHAGRQFATGFGVGDVVGWLRPGTAALLVDRRGVPEHRLVRLPIPLARPLSESRARRARHRVRRRLGIPSDAVCLVTMGSAAKYVPVDEVALPDLLADACARNPDLHVVAVGPRWSPIWRAAAERSGGRVRALGPLPDAAPYLAAADLAIDAFPISSETAVRDAALAGLPVVSFASWRRVAPAFAVDLPGAADAHLRRADDPAALADLLDRLVRDTDLRRASGSALRAAVAADGLGEGFRDGVEAVYVALGAARRMSADQLADPPRRYDATDALASAMARAGERARSERVPAPRVGPGPDPRERILASALVSHRARVCYVPTPKAGCTSVKWLLARIEGRPDDRLRGLDRWNRSPEAAIHFAEVHGLPTLAGLPVARQEEILRGEDWMRLGVTRDPYARVVSAWAQRVLVSLPESTATGIAAPDLDVRGPGETLDLGASFRRFVDELVRPGSRFADDEHFMPQVGFLGLDLVDYTDLVDVADLDRVASVVRARAARWDLPDPPRNHGLEIEHGRLYDAPTARAVERHYEADFAALGYPVMSAPAEPAPVVLDAHATDLIDQVRAANRRIADLSTLARRRTGARYGLAQLRAAMARRR